jgi:Ni/Co efflux regulator RcnB
MKKLILLAAATMIAVPANAAAGGRHEHDRAYVQKVQKQRVIQRTNRHVIQSRTAYRQPVRVQQVRVQMNRDHQWSRGQRFDRRYAANYRVIDNYRAYHLNAPPYGYHYVQSNNDIVLVAIASGIIGAVFGNLL